VDTEVGAVAAFLDGGPEAHFRSVFGMDEEFDENTQLEKLAISAELIIGQEMEWVWPGRIPVGFLTALVGPRASGKSLVLADVAARVSSGIPWPDDPFQQRRTPKPASVLYITTEESLAKNVLPRLKRAGADLAKIKLLCYPRVEAYKGRTARSKQIERWRLVASKVPDLRLVVIDELGPLLGSANNRRNRELEEFLSLIVQFAHERNVGVVIANGRDKLSEGKSWSSGVDVVAHLHEHARMVWEIEVERETTKNKFLLPVQIGLDDDPGGLAFNVHPQFGYVAWHDEPVPVFAGSRPVSAARSQSQVERAVPWLHQYLTQGPMASKAIFEDGAAVNLGTHALRTAKDLLGVKSNKLTGKRWGGWEWELPLPSEDDLTKPPQIARYWRTGLNADDAGPDVEADLPVCLQNETEIGRPGGLPPREEEVGRAGAATQDDKVTERRFEVGGVTFYFPNHDEIGGSDGLLPQGNEDSKVTG
jgi:hypothetical protein